MFAVHLANPKSITIAGLMEVYDADESGLIEFNEFERLYKVVQRKKSKQSSGEDWLDNAEQAVK